MAGKPPLDVNWVKVEEAIDQIHKILYDFYSRDSEHSSGEMAVTVSTPKN